MTHTGFKLPQFSLTLEIVLAEVKRNECHIHQHLSQNLGRNSANLLLVLKALTPVTGYIS